MLGVSLFVTHTPYSLWLRFIKKNIEYKFIYTEKYIVKTENEKSAYGQCSPTPEPKNYEI